MDLRTVPAEVRLDARRPDREWENLPAERLVCPVPDSAPRLPDRFPHLGTVTARYPYRNEEGQLLGYILRWDQLGGSKEIRPCVLIMNKIGVMAWKFGGFPVPRPLYNLDQLAARPSAPVLVVEGEKTADAAAVLFPNYVVTTAMQGAQSVSKTDLSPLVGRDVLIWPDADAAGEKYGRDIARGVHALQQTRQASGSADPVVYNF